MTNEPQPSEVQPRGDVTERRPAPAKSGVADKRRGALSMVYLGSMILVGVLTIAVTMLWQNIANRKQEAEQHAFRVVALNDDLLDPAEWGKNYPRQYELYLRNQELAETKYGGGVNFQKIDKYPVWRTLFKGYAFGVDYREERGHQYMLSDQDETERVKQFKQPGSCLHCHSSITKAYRDEGRKA